MKKYFIPMQHTHSCVAGLYFHGGNIVENREKQRYFTSTGTYDLPAVGYAEDEGALPESEQAGI